MKSFRLSLSNGLSLPFAQSLGNAMPPGAVENVGRAFPEPLGYLFVEPGTLSHGRSQLHRQRTLAAPKKGLIVVDRAAFVPHPPTKSDIPPKPASRDHRRSEI
jgi:hypothetical protein